MTDIERLYKPNEVALIFGVSSKTVGRWAASGKLPFTRTLGGHKRYRDSDIKERLAESEPKE